MNGLFHKTGLHLNCLGRPKRALRFLSSGRRGRRGFSLIEVVIALAIIGFALVSMLGLLLVGLTNGHDSQQKTFAAMVQRDALQRIRSVWQYLDTTTLPIGPAAAGAAFTHSFFYNDGGGYLGDDSTSQPTTPLSFYKATVSLSALTDPYPTGISDSSGQLAALTVTVQWPLQQNGTPFPNASKIIFVTYIAKNTDSAWPTPTPNDRQ